MSLTSSKRNIHFVGIGGIGMSGLAELLIRLGHEVSGSDVQASSSVERLKALGARVQVGHGAQVFHGHKPDVVVYSTAVHMDNEELAYAKAHSIPIIRRAEMLAELMRLKRGIAIAGSHGKTTTTGLSSLLLKHADLDPTVVIGGRFDAIGSNAAWGAGSWLVAEADESDGSFLRLSPEIAVLTNIDREHMDHYGSFSALLDAFREFLDRLPFYGRAVLCSDCENVREVARGLSKPVVFYGLHKQEEPDFWVQVTSTSPIVFDVWTKSSGYKEKWLSAKLSVPGTHNALNATAAALVAREVGVSVNNIQNTLLKYEGVSRRFERLGLWNGHPVIEDYAHHPTEIRATLEAARGAFPGKALCLIFQPHRFSRTRDLWNEFKTCFFGLNRLITLPIYSASEPRLPWVETIDGVAFAKNVEGVATDYCASLGAAVERVKEMHAAGLLQKDSPILIFGAGDVSKIGRMLVDEGKAR